MFYYARSDTHYLLYVYDQVRNDLIEHSDEADPEKNLIEHVLQKSKETSLLRHENAICDAQTGRGQRGWYNAIAYSRSPLLLNGEQFSVFKALWQWRDDIARREDESTPFILQPQSLIQLAKLSTLR